MHPTFARRNPLPSQVELDARLELLQQLGLEDRVYWVDDDAPRSTKLPSFDSETDRWIQTEYDWALEEASEPAELFDVEEEDDACLPFVYDPTLFPTTPTTPRGRAHSLTASDALKRANNLASQPRTTLPPVPPPTPVARSPSSSPTPPQSLRWARPFNTPSPPPSPYLRSTASISPRSGSGTHPRIRPRSITPPTIGQRGHAAYPSISSTLSLLEERETEEEKRSAVYVADLSDAAILAPPAGRARSSSNTLPLRSDSAFGTAPFSRRRPRPSLPTLSTSASSPQLRTLAELASIPSPSYAPSTSTLLPSLMDGDELDETPEITDHCVITPGEAISTRSSLDSPETHPSGSRWSLDSVASRPRISEEMGPDLASSSPASKTKKRDRLLSFISRSRSGSVVKPSFPPTPRGSSEALDIGRRSLSREPAFVMVYPHHRPSYASSSSAAPPKISMSFSTSSSSSSNASTVSTLATPVEPMFPSSLPDVADSSLYGLAESPPCSLDDPMFATNPDLPPDSPLLGTEDPPSHPMEPFSLSSYSRPGTPTSPPLLPTLAPPSPSTPSPSFLVPSSRPGSFFSLKGRQRRRRKKLVISGAPLTLDTSRPSNATSQDEVAEIMRHREREQQRRVDNVKKWCESFGALRKVEQKEDGSLTVFWKEWEVADMVCRIQAQVVIKDVGRVSLAWYYIT